MNYIKSLPLYRATRLINEAQEQLRVKSLYQYYLAIRPAMTEKNYVPFDKFLEQNTPVKVVIDTRSQDEILAELFKEREI